jgi:branched-chain amino acid transport system substrate-binding protein
MRHKIQLALLVALVLVIATACTSPTPETVREVVKETVVVQKEATVVVEKEKEVVVTATPAPMEAGEADTIRIGGLGPLSAPGTVVGGIAMQFAMNLAVQDINDQGGVLGKPMELIFADTEGLPERGAAVAERLIDENGVVALAGEYHSAVGLAIAEVAREKHVPVLFSETWADAITETGYPEVFRIAPASTMVSRATAEWLADVGVQNIVIIAENTDYGTGQAEADQKFFEDLGMTVADTIFVELGTQDYQPILARIQAMDPPPDVIRVAVTGENSYNLERQITDLGLAPTEATIGIANQVAIQSEFWESVPNGEYWTFTLVGLPPSLYNDTTRRVAEAYQAQFDTQPPSYALEAYDTMWILADAIERAGTTEPDALIQALEQTDIELAQGHYYFEYTSANPVPDDVPDYMWHQWPDPAVLILQYFEQGQGPADAAVIWPPAYQTHGTNYITPGTQP